MRARLSAADQIRRGLPALALLWLALVLGGLFALSRYKASPGEAARAPARWPEASRLSRTAGLPTLLMFAHPFCPCTRASLAELARLLARAGAPLSAHVLFVKPEGAEGDWEDSDLWDSARAVPGVDAQRDGDGREAALFNTSTSGQVLLYGAGGELLFQGGITASRGHEGDNAGTGRVLALLRGQDTGAPATPVFGCSLHDPQPTGGP